jgi:hypothetical protein
VRPAALVLAAALALGALARAAEPQAPEPSPPRRLEDSVERGGLKLTLRVERGVFDAGEVVWADVVVANVSQRSVSWYAAGCPPCAAVASVVAVDGRRSIALEDAPRFEARQGGAPVECPRAMCAVVRDLAPGAEVEGRFGFQPAHGGKLTIEASLSPLPPGVRSVVVGGPLAAHVDVYVKGEPPPAAGYPQSPVFGLPTGADLPVPVPPHPSTQYQ